MPKANCGKLRSRRGPNGSYGIEPKHPYYTVCESYTFRSRTACIDQFIHTFRSLKYSKSIHHHSPPKQNILLRDKHSAEVDLAIIQVIHGLGNTLLGHRVLLHNRLDLVQRGELQHLLVEVTRSYNGALDAKTLEDERHVRDGEVAAGDGERVDGCVGSEGGDEERPVGLGGGGDEEAVDGAGGGDLFLVLGGDELLRAEPHGLVLLAVGTGEDDDVAALLGGELDGEMAKTADTNDTDSLSGLGVVGAEGVEDSSTTTHQGRSVLIGHVVRNAKQECLPPHGVAGEGPLVEVGHAVHLALGAVGFLALQALLAVTAAIVLVTPADSVTLLHVLDVRAGLLDDTDTLMAERAARLAVVLVSA